MSSFVEARRAQRVAGGAAARASVPVSSGGRYTAARARRRGRVVAGRPAGPAEARERLAAAWEHLAHRVDALRVEPDPLGATWRRAWAHQVESWRAANAGELDAAAIGVWARRLSPWAQEFARRTADGVSVGAMSRRQLQTEIERLSSSWRALKRDVESFPRDESNPFPEEWRTQFAGAYTRFREWADRVIAATGFERWVWQDETETEIQSQRAELVRYRAEFEELTGRPPSGAAPIARTTPPSSRGSWSDWFSGALTGGAGGALLLGGLLLALAVARR